MDSDESRDHDYRRCKMMMGSMKWTDSARTERLPGLLGTWNIGENIPLIKHRRGGPSDTIELNGKASHWPTILAMLSEVRDYADRHCHEQGQRFTEEFQLPRTFPRPISPGVSMSLTALTKALTQAVSTTYEISRSDLLLRGTYSILWEDNRDSPTKAGIFFPSLSQNHTKSAPNRGSPNLLCSLSRELQETGIKTRLPQYQPK